MRKETMAGLTINSLTLRALRRRGKSFCSLWIKRVNRCPLAKKEKKTKGDCKLVEISSFISVTSYSTPEYQRDRKDDLVFHVTPRDHNL